MYILEGKNVDFCDFVFCLERLFGLKILRCSFYWKWMWYEC